MRDWGSGRGHGSTTYLPLLAPVAASLPAPGVKLGARKVKMAADPPTPAGGPRRESGDVCTARSKL